MRNIAVVLLVACLSMPAWAQPPNAILEGYGEADTLKISGADLPFYYVVYSFYENGVGWLTEWGTFYDQYLLDFGVVPGSDAAAVVTEAMLKSEPIVRGHAPLDTSLADDPAAFEAMQIERIKARARKLAGIFAEMIVGLERAGFPTAKLEGYLEGTVRRQSALYLVGSSKRRLENSRSSTAEWLGVDRFEHSISQRIEAVRRQER